MLGGGCPLGFLLLLFFFIPSKLCVFRSHLVSRAGCGVRLYRLLIIAFSSTLPPSNCCFLSILSREIPDCTVAS